MALFVHNGLLLAVLWALSLCIAATAANGWTHPTGRRSGAARLLGLGDAADAWEAMDADDGSRGRRGGWSSGSGAGVAGVASAASGAVGAGVGAGAGAGLPVPPPWPHTQAQEQQMLDAVGGLGKRHGHGPDEESLTSTDSSWTSRTTAPSPAIFTALGSVGVLSDLSSFFNNLQENLESMENMTPEERRLVLGGDAPQLLPQAGPGRPMSAPALMTSLRNHRPSFRTRHFVETSEPAALRRSNNHDPQLLWAGIGR